MDALPYRDNVDPVSDETDIIKKQDEIGGRALFAENLEKLVSAMVGGGVISIDAPWGCGKTWFAEKWQQDISNKGYKGRCVYINACEHENEVDPFVPLAGEILSVLESATNYKTILETVCSVGKRLVPGAVKMAVDIAGRWALGTSNLSENVQSAIQAGVDDAAAQLVEKQIREWAERKKSNQDFKNAIQEGINSIAGNGKPFVVIIDELDRCNPIFAVHYIERIKQLFEVEKLVFVLMINAEQLRRVVHTTYGSGMSSDKYIDKYINIQLSLPFSKKQKAFISQEYCSSILRRYGYNSGWSLSELFFVWGFSPREVERVVFSHGIIKKGEGYPIPMFLIMYKVRFPDEYRKLREGGRAEVEELQKLIDKVINEYPNLSCRLTLQHVKGVLSSLDDRPYADLSMGFEKVKSIQTFCSYIDSFETE